MIRLTSLFLFLGVGMFAPNFCAAEDVQKPFVLAVTVSNFSGEIPVHAHVIDDAGFDIESGDGVKHEFQLKNPDPLKPAKLAYVLEFVMGDRTERFYLSVRDVHFGRTLSFPIDGRPVDTAVRNILINKNCKNVLSGVTSFINEIVVCRKMYLTYDGGSYVDRFSALRGWFDASKALAAMPSSPFRIDPDVIRVVQKFENADPSEGPAAISTYRTFFPADYVKIAMNDLAGSRLADFREIGNLVKSGDTATAAKVNEFSTQVFESVAGTGATARKYVNGLSRELLDQQKVYLQTLRSSLSNSPPM